MMLGCPLLAAVSTLMEPWLCQLSQDHPQRPGITLPVGELVEAAQLTHASLFQLNQTLSIYKTFLRAEVLEFM